jgi:hypothetical protein
METFQNHFLNVFVFPTLAAYSLVKLRESDGYINRVLIKPAPVDETLPIINKPKQPKKGNTRNKMEGSTSKMKREPSKRENHKGNIKFLNPLLLQETYQIGKGGGPLKGHLAQKNPHLRQ